MEPNIVSCPHCGREFIHAKVNGIALIEAASSIEARKRMHCRLTLNTLEEYFQGKLPAPVKKAVLDGYNDLARDVHAVIGFGTEVEG